MKDVCNLLAINIAKFITDVTYDFLMLWRVHKHQTHEHIHTDVKVWRESSLTSWKALKNKAKIVVFESKSHLGSWFELGDFLAGHLGQLLINKHLHPSVSFVFICLELEMWDPTSFIVFILDTQHHSLLIWEHFPLISPTALSSTLISFTLRQATSALYVQFACHY